MNVNDQKQKEIEERREAHDTTESPTKTKKRISAGTLLSSIGKGLLYALFGYCMGGATLPFGAAPFGIAMLCATDRRVLYVYAGLCVSAWFGGSRVLLISTYTAILLVRFLVRLVLDTPWSRTEGETMGEKTLGQVWHVLFSEQIGLRMSTSAIAAFGVGLHRLMAGGFLYYDLYGTILMTLAAPVAVLLFTGYWGKAKIGSERYLSGLLSIAFVLIWAVGDAKLYSVSLGVFGGMLLTLYLTRKQGLVAGVIAGVVCGLAVSVPLAPAFAFGALAAGLLLPVSVFFAAISAVSVGLAWGAYVNGIGILDGMVSAFLASCLLFVVLDKLFFKDTAQEASEEEANLDSKREEAPICQPLPRLERDGVRLMESHRRTRALGESFAALSEVFWGMSRRMQTPAAADLRQICDNAFDSSCASCSEKSRCWGERYHETSGEVGQLCTALHKRGRVERVDAADTLASRCGRLPDILEEINHNTALHRREIHEGDRTEIFAMDYQAMAELLLAMAPEQEESDEEDEVSKRLCEALTELRLDLAGACVLGTHRRRVVVCGRERKRLLEAEERIRTVIEKVCPFSVQEGILAEGDAAVLSFFEKELLSVSFAKRSLCAEGEEKYCGDTVGTFRDPSGSFYALISDGMGAGREAAMTSGISGLFLQKLLSAGNSCETALRMLNAFLRNRGSGSLHECSATIDLMELDLLSGRAYFYKSGAAPTYVFRNGSLFKLRSHTVPVGIIRELDTRRIEFDVSDGDLIVMVSDGVTQGKEECPWLFDLLRSRAEDTPERISDRIVRYAKNEGSGDDISVLVIQIKKQ